MCEKLKSLKEVKGSDTNPFLVELQGKMYLQPRANTIIAKGQGVVDTNTGELISDDVLIGRRRIVDKSQFAKIYASEVGILFSLSKAAINVFMHLTKVMDFENKALFDYMKEYEKCGYKTEVPPLRGIRELITRGIIYPHTISGIWWLNPTIVCKGERFAKYTEYVTKERYEADNKRFEKERLKAQAEFNTDALDEKTRGALAAMDAKAAENYFKKENLEQEKADFEKRQLNLFE